LLHSRRIRTGSVWRGQAIRQVVIQAHAQCSPPRWSVKGGPEKHICGVPSHCDGTIGCVRRDVKHVLVQRHICGVVVGPVVEKRLVAAASVLDGHKVCRAPATACVAAIIVLIPLQPGQMHHARGRQTTCTIQWCRKGGAGGTARDRRPSGNVAQSAFAILVARSTPLRTWPVVATLLHAAIRVPAGSIGAGGFSAHTTKLLRDARSIHTAQAGADQVVLARTARCTRCLTAVRLWETHIALALCILCTVRATGQVLALWIQSAARVGAHGRVSAARMWRGRGRRRRRWR
jgi:hypothetical protein